MHNFVLAYNTFVLSKKMLNAPDFRHAVTTSRIPVEASQATTTENTNRQQFTKSRRSAVEQKRRHILFVNASREHWRMLRLLIPTQQQTTWEAWTLFHVATQFRKAKQHQQRRHTDINVYEHNTNAKAAPRTPRMRQCGIRPFLRNSAVFFVCLSYKVSRQWKKH